jgi:predicted NBD/HSP70 family sugar kinase
MKRRTVQTITATEMRAINRSAILELIRSTSPISRSEIGSRLQVSLPTVMRIVDDLIGDGLVRSTGASQWSGGRKRALVEFNGKAHLVIGVDLGGTKLYGAVADLTGAILHEQHIIHHQSQSEESYTVLCTLIDGLMDFARGTGLPVRGMGVGVPGVTNPQTGLVELAPSLEWSGFPLRDRLTGRYRLPVVIENDVNLAAVGELWFGPDGDADNLVLIAIGTGIGAGIVIDGMVYPGAHHMAGEVGYFLPERANLGQPYPGFGAFEQLASGSGIAARAKAHLRQNPGMHPFSAQEIENLTTEDVFAAARQGQSWPAPVLAETVDYLAQAIASIQQVVDPDVILLGGGVSRSADLLIEPILARLRGTIPILPRLEASRLGYRAAVMGAIVQLLRVTSNYYSLHKYS